MGHLEAKLEKALKEQLNWWFSSGSSRLSQKEFTRAHFSLNDSLYGMTGETGGFTDDHGNFYDDASTASLLETEVLDPFIESISSCSEYINSCGVWFDVQTESIVPDIAEQEKIIYEHNVDQAEDEINHLLDNEGGDIVFDRKERVDQFAKELVVGDIRDPNMYRVMDTERTKEILLGADIYNTFFT